MTELFDSLPARPVLRTCMQYLIAFYSRLEAAIDVMFGKSVRLIDSDNAEEFRVSGLNSSRQIRPEDSRRRHFRPFSFSDNCRPEVAGDALSGVAV